MVGSWASVLVEVKPADKGEVQRIIALLLQE